MSRERGSPHIEVFALLVILDVGEETDEPAHTHHEDQMEVGKRLLAAIQPQDAVLQIGKERFVLLFTARAVIKEFSQEQGDAELIGVEGDGSVGLGNPCVTKMLQLRLRTDIQLHLEEVQGLEILLLQLPLGRLGNMGDDRYPAVTLGKQIDNHLLLTIFQNPEHNGPRFCYHIFERSLQK